MLAYVRTQVCSACSYRSVDAHHVTSKGSGGDDTLNNLMPLCRVHHSEIHQIGNSRMCEKYGGVKSWFVKYKRYDQLERAI